MFHRSFRKSPALQGRLPAFVGSEVFRCPGLGCIRFPLTPPLSLGERIPRNKSRFEPPNRRAAKVFSRSSSGGVGWGEEAVSRKLRARFVGRGHPFQCLGGSNRARFADGLAAILPLPKAEGR